MPERRLSRKQEVGWKSARSCRCGWSGDGAADQHESMRHVAGHGWNETAVAPNGNLYVNGFPFDLANGGAPQTGIIALVRPDGSAVQVAGGLQFPNGMVITADGSTLVVAESFARLLTAFDAASDGTLANRRVWASGVGPDGICLDSDGAIWCGAADIQMMTGRPSDPAGASVRVHEGGRISGRVEVDRPTFSGTLGGPDDRTLFLLTAEWRGFDQMDATAADRTGQVLTQQVEAPAAAMG